MPVLEHVELAERSARRDAERVENESILEAFHLAHLDALLLDRL